MPRWTTSANGLGSGVAGVAVAMALLPASLALAGLGGHRGEAGPGDEVAGGGEAGHIQADLGDDGAGQVLADAGDLREAGDGWRHRRVPDVSAGGEDGPVGVRPPRGGDLVQAGGKPLLGGWCYR